MTEQSKFEELLGKRLGPTVHRIELLGNLVNYPHSEQEAKDLALAVLSAVRKLHARFSKKWGWQQQKAAPPPPKPTQRAHDAVGGPLPLDAYDEVAWAYDAILRGDTELALSRLGRVLKDPARPRRQF